MYIYIKKRRFILSCNSTTKKFQTHRKQCNLNINTNNVFSDLQNANKIHVIKQNKEFSEDNIACWEV